MSTFVAPGHRALVTALLAGLVVALMPFAIALTPEKAVAAHLVGVVIAALAARALRWPGRGDGLLMAGAGALVVTVPIWVWQMPAGPAWALPALGALVAVVGLRHAVLRGDIAAPRQDPTPPATGG
ncbi:hypothetical protein [Roseivivax isoporae]|uniref:SPW repeat-containing protein n=1 Tax=Roseivivax isoporae LMG 25204 TaxID=1449351 RepID=X7F6U0_9RHOB|nr:hypothetical protein [Roseivivax isoporae]ETX28617.1 hypothetical protein RISW2_05855 [Roseivivax isoporae LMG 25204]